METTRKPSVITVKFGDGYEQRRAGGLNADLKTFKPVFRVTDEYSRAALDSFIPSCRGSCFCGVRQNTTGLSGCLQEWSISDNAMYTDFNCTFEEVTH